MTTRSLLLACALAGVGLASCDSPTNLEPARSPAAQPPSMAKTVSGSLTVNLDATLALDGNTVKVGGTVAINQFTVSGGQIMASGTLNLLVTINGTSIPVSESFTTSAAVSATCTGGGGTLTVRLDHLSLASAGIDLGQLTLVIPAPSGTQLGDLVCSLADALASGSLQAQLNLLNKIISTTPPTVSVVLDASVTLNRFTSSNGQLFLSATITGTASVNGTTLTVNETINVAASVTATCGTPGTLTITLSSVSVSGLPLTLGPVTASISADAGTTLGDLICDVSRLLSSSGSTRQLLKDLNQILASL
ncbi:MAG TPA: hypothetical protein VF771_08115 [Longimicrobiaceae bacterium]